MNLPPGFKLEDSSSQQASPQPAVNLPPGFKLEPLTPGTGDQKSGFVPTTEDLKSLLPNRTSVLPMVGMGIGGTYGGVPGAAAGSAIGEGLNQGIEKIGERYGFDLLKQKPPQTIGESASRIGGEAVKGAIGEGLGRYVLNPFMKALGRYAFPGADMATQQAVRTAEEQGIKALPNMISENKGVAGIQRAAEYSPFGSSISRAREEALNKFGDYAQRVGEQIGPDKAPELNGSLVKESAKGFYDNFNKVKAELYQSVDPKIKNIPVDVSNTLDALQTFIKSRTGEAEPALIDTARGWLENVAGKKVPSQVLDKSGKPYLQQLSSTVKTFDELTKFGRNIADRANFFDPSNPGLQGQLKMLGAAIQKDADNALEKYGDSSAVDALQKANDYLSNGKTVLGSKIYKALVATPQGNEWKIAFSANDPMAYDTVKEVVGEDTMKNLARQWYENLFTKSTKNGVTSPQLLLNNLDKAQPIIDHIAEDYPQAVGQLNKLKEVATLMTKNSDVMKGSQTAPLASLYGVLSEIGGSIGAMFAHPVAGAAGVGVGVGALGASKAASSAITSDWLRNALTKGYPTIQPAVESAVSKVTVPARYLAAKGATEYTKRRVGLAGETNR